MLSRKFSLDIYFSSPILVSQSLLMVFIMSKLLHTIYITALNLQMFNNQWLKLSKPRITSSVNSVLYEPHSVHWNGTEHAILLLEFQTSNLIPKHIIDNKSSLYFLLHILLLHDILQLTFICEING